MEIVEIDLHDRSYSIYIGKGILKNFLNSLEETGEKNFLITDENIASLYRNTLKDLSHYEQILIKPGEDSKSFAVVEDILSRMLKKGATRKSKILAIGGGVVGDVAGFCSSIYMRGIPYIQIPTTLLAQVDSSVGGKTGINLLEYKNSIGSFYQPKQVIIDLDFLKTLPVKERICGIGEILKYGIIYDYEFLSYLMENIEALKNCQEEIMALVIKRCLEIKGEIVAKDEREGGLRKILNFGHTIGHALEGISSFSRYTHGEAVIIGMYYETLLAKKKGLVKKDYAQELLNFFKTLEIDLNLCHYPTEELINWMLKDKKNLGEKISFIFPIDEGRVEEFLLDKEEILW